MTKTFPVFLCVAGAMFATLLMLVAGVNYHYDPANLFGDRTYEAGIARLLSEGKNVANITDYDERLLQKFFVERLKNRRDVLVLGSSRSMNLGPDLFPGMTFYNASVSGASLEDDYAILQLYREHNLLPRLVVLGVDPWVFNRNSEQTRWKSLEQEYRRSMYGNVLGTASSELAGDQRLSKLQQLVSFDYFRAALHAAHRADRDYYATNATELDVNMRLADGTITYNREHAHRSPEKVAEVAHQQAARIPIYSLGQFRELDAEYIKLLEAFIEHLCAEGIEVVLFLPPYHPDMYAAITHAGSPYRLVKDAEDYLRRFAGQQNLQVWGSFDPNITSCGRDDFYDEMHPRSTCVTKIFAGFSSPRAERKPITGSYLNDHGND